MTDGFFLLCSKFWKDWCSIFNWYFVIDWLIDWLAFSFKQKIDWEQNGIRPPADLDSDIPLGLDLESEMLLPSFKWVLLPMLFSVKARISNYLFRYFRIDMLRLKMENAKLVEKLKTQLEMPRTADTTTLIPDVVGHTEKLSEYATNFPVSEANEAESIPDRLDAIPVSCPLFFARARYSCDWERFPPLLWLVGIHMQVFWGGA